MCVQCTEIQIVSATRLIQTHQEKGDLARLWEDS